MKKKNLGETNSPVGTKILMVNQQCLVEFFNDATCENSRMSMKIIVRSLFSCVPVKVEDLIDLFFSLQSKEKKRLILRFHVVTDNPMKAALAANAK